MKYRSVIHQLLTLLLIVSAVLMSACHRDTGPTPEEIQAVKAVMEKRAIAIKNKDIEMYKDVFLPDYDDGHSNYQMIVAEMAENFKQYETIEFTYQRSPVDLKMNSARMVGKVSYKTDRMQKPVFNHERTLFRRVDGQWYISGGMATGLF